MMATTAMIWKRRSVLVEMVVLMVQEVLVVQMDLMELVMMVTTTMTALEHGCSASLLLAMPMLLDTPLMMVGA
jgi:hypothetical protein